MSQSSNSLPRSRFRDLEWAFRPNFYQAQSLNLVLFCMPQYKMPKEKKALLQVLLDRETTLSYIED